MNYIEYIAEKCKPHGIFIDTELLLTICVGKFNPQLISTFKKTNKYTIEDFERLNQIVNKFTPVYVSPHVLAELSNHLDMFGEKHLHDLYQKAINYIKTNYEIFIPKEDIVGDLLFPEIGFADMSVFKICLQKECVLFTADRKLTSILRYRGLEVVNYNELRGLIWFS